MTPVWVLAGLVGGAAAGLVDAVVAIAGGIGGMSVGKALRLIALSASLLAAAGGVGGLVIAGGDSLARRMRLGLWKKLEADNLQALVRKAARLLGPADRP